MKRLELKQVRICQRCGRGRAELESPDGDRLSVALDPVRARALSEPGDDGVRWLADLVLAQMRASGARPAEVVLDQGDGGLRALLTFHRRGADSDVVACTAQEGIGLVVQGGLDLYATDEALAEEAQKPGERGPSLH